MRNAVNRRYQVILAIRVICLVFVAPVLFADDASDAADAYRRGTNELRRKDYEKAVSEFTKAFQLQPKEAKYQGMLAVALLEKGDCEQGMAALKAAIELHPNDAGASYKPQTDKELSPEAIAHGREQVRKMLADRPAMAKHAEAAEFLRQWAVRKFAGEDLGSLIDWDPEPPVDSDAEHAAPDEHHHGSIQVHPKYTHGRRAGRPRGFEELWAGAVYELHNINFAKHFVKLHELVAEGKVTKEEFVGGIVKHEVVAAQQTRAFYLQEFLPFAAKQKLTTRPSLWFADWWDQPDEALKGFTNKSVYPWQPYARQFDWLSVERHFRLTEYNHAIELLTAMCDEATAEDDHADIHFWLGRCRLKSKQYEKAVEEFTTAIHFLPDEPDYYHHRAEAYKQLGDKEKSAADEKKYKELTEK